MALRSWSRGNRGRRSPPGQLSWLGAALEWVSAAIDALAILLLLVGAFRFIPHVLRAELSRLGANQVRRTNRGRIEPLIVSDTNHSALSLAISNVVYLGLLVVIRLLISYSLDR